LLPAIGLILLMLAPVAGPGEAQDRTTLIRVLNGNADFRVRVQAAFALGNTRDAAVLPALERAMRDSNPAVRAAAATAMGRIGSPNAIPILRRAQRDSSAAVRLQVSASLRAIESGERREAALPAARARADHGARFPAITVIPSEDRIRWPRMRYIVFLGEMQNRARFGGDGMASLLRSEVGRNLGMLRNVVVWEPNRPFDARGQAEIRRRNLPKLRLDGNVVTLQRQNRGADLAIRCEVSLMLLDEPQRALRGELRGAATGSEPRRSRSRRAQERRLAEQALEGAVRSAMSNVHQAIQRAAHR
jgi:hypothetical protein